MIDSYDKRNTQNIAISEGSISVPEVECIFEDLYLEGWSTADAGFEETLIRALQEKSRAHDNARTLAEQFSEYCRIQLARK